METISAEDMKIADENSEYLGVPRSLLMENAGRGILENIIKRKKVTDSNIVIFSGTGNNGGDGFVAARHLASVGAKVHLILIGDPAKIRTPESRQNWKALEKMELTIEKILISDTSDFEKIQNIVKNADVLIDAMLGTGITGRIREPFSTAIDLFNTSEAFKIAIDVPTGLDPESGQIQDKVVKADVTVTFHKAKPGLIDKDCTGELEIWPIGIPPEAEIIAGPGDVKSVVKRRDPYSHKGDFGKVLVIGGSKYYSGAPALAALAALRTGVDLVIVTPPAKIAQVIRGYSPDLIVRELPGEVLNKEALPILRNLIQDWATGIVVGPGLGLDEETRETLPKIFQLIKEKDLPLLVDADALKILANERKTLYGTKTVLTPHQGEFLQLTGEKLPPPSKLKDRMKMVEDWAKELGVTILLKAHEDIISDGKRTKINTTGNPGMSVGGTGDVLSGICAAFLSQGYKPCRAAVAAAFINGIAGDLAVEKKGFHITATDLITLIPETIKVYES
ncbi:MAG: NAD(P)H-hydrate dehydratase [Candidatus Jordarchaeum sp.]|uniref:NAD(P)H-hydrate dehydratase n=1 Tax=Candidatus Jordarchaeum sp. TaxID=2823881 RepID=UPI00404B05BF